MTRGDRFRNKTDEELAEWMLNEAYEFIEKFLWCKSDCGATDDCPHIQDCLMKWLQEDAEE